MGSFVKYIKAFLGIMESDEKFWKRKRDEIKFRKQLLSEEELMWIESISFENQLDFTFKSLDEKDISVCLAIGAIIALSAVIIDSKGKDLEDSLNKIKIKDFEGNYVRIKKFDTNNIFDLKRGNHHRNIAHDFNFLKCIPGDYILPNGKAVNEIIGIDKEYHLFYSLIKEYYNLPDNKINQLKAIMKLTGIHMMKDIVTPEGLPIPFTSLFTKFEENYMNLCGYSTSNLLCEVLGDELGHIKFSDLTSNIMKKALMNIYVNYAYKDIKFTKQAKKALKSQMNIVIDSAIITLQMIIMILGKKNCEGALVNGGRTNIILFRDFGCNCKNLLQIMSKDNNKLLGVYKNKREIWRWILMKPENIKEYNSSFKIKYHYENDENYYIRKDILEEAYEKCEKLKSWKERDIEQLNKLYTLEKNKIDLVENVLEIKQFRENMVKIVRGFSEAYDISVFEETKIHNKFYELINEIYEKMEE